MMLVLVGCGSAEPGAEPSTPGPIAGTPRPPSPVRALRETDRWSRIAVPVAFAADGERWIGAADYQLTVYAGDRQVAQFPGTVGMDDQLAPLAGGGWIAGGQVLADDGTVRFAGWAKAQQYGRFSTTKAAAISPDARVGIFYAHDSPSTCLCDRDRGTGGSWDGGLARLSLDREDVAERMLADPVDRMDYAVAASTTAVVALSRDELSIWPATGDGPPTVVKLADPPSALWFATDRYLVGKKYVDVNRDDIVVLDRDAGWQPVFTWTVPGTLRGLAIRPGTNELAIGWTNYHATTQVWRDDRKLGVFALDGTPRVVLDITQYPMSVAWSPRGDALLLSATGTKAEDAYVARFAVEP